MTGDPLDARIGAAVHVTAMRLGLTADEPTRDWYAWCGSCNWYGQEHEDVHAAQSDAARHRREHARTLTALASAFAPGEVSDRG